MRLALLAPLVLAVGCGDDLGGGPSSPDAAPVTPVGVAACATWTATPEANLTPADGASSLFPQVVAFDDGWGALWYDERDGNDAYYARLGPDGARLGPDLEITTEARVNDSPAVASSGAELLVTWGQIVGAEPAIYAKRVGKDGETLSPAVNVSRSASGSTRAAAAATRDGWAVAWVEYNNGLPLNEEIKVARLDPTGDPIGDPVQLTDAPGSSYAPTVAAADGDARVAWHDDRSGAFDVWTSPMADGPSGAPIATTDADQLVPSLAWGGGAWGIVYHDDRALMHEVYFALADPTGTMVHETLLSDPTNDASFGRIAWAGDAWVVTWQEHLGLDMDRVRAVRVGTDGAVIGEPVEVVAKSSVGAADVAVDAHGVTAVVWQEARIGAEIRFARVLCSP